MARRLIFLQRMDGLVPWKRQKERFRPSYPKTGQGRRPYELRVHCLQLFHNLGDPSVEDMLYEVEAVRNGRAALSLPGPRWEPIRRVQYYRETGIGLKYHHKPAAIYTRRQQTARSEFPYTQTEPFSAFTSVIRALGCDDGNQSVVDRLCRVVRGSPVYPQFG